MSDIDLPDSPAVAACRGLSAARAARDGARS